MNASDSGAADGAENIVPVCAGCGKVGDGQGSWASPETAAAPRAAAVSHGICPDCRSRLYPGLE